jgi:CRISPR/Cas system-associated protein Csx1
MAEIQSQLKNAPIGSSKTTEPPVFFKELRAFTVEFLERNTDPIYVTTLAEALLTLHGYTIEKIARRQLSVRLLLLLKRLEKEFVVSRTENNEWYALTFDQLTEMVEKINKKSESTQ